MTSSFKVFLFLQLLSIFVPLSTSASPETIKYGIDSKQSSPLSPISSSVSSVNITVGEKPDFLYYASGKTYSRGKISLQGQYFDDKDVAYGYTDIFLVVPSGVRYFSYRYGRNILDVYIENPYRDTFLYQIQTPRIVGANMLQIAQINATAVLAKGPAKSFFIG